MINARYLPANLYSALLEARRTVSPPVVKNTMFYPLTEQYIASLVKTNLLCYSSTHCIMSYWYMVSQFQTAKAFAFKILTPSYFIAC